MLGTLPPAEVLWLAFWYSFGCHGIMTLNDFKSVDGDRRMGVRSLPAQLGVPRAAWVACGFMLVAQLAVIVLLAAWGRPLHAAAIAGLTVLQFSMMVRMLGQPAELDFWYNTKGVPLFVAGMLISAFAIRGG
jgi:chlorophyll synthase